MELAQQYALKVEWDRSSLGLSQIQGISYEQEKMTQTTDLRAQRLKKKKKKRATGKQNLEQNWTQINKYFLSQTVLEQGELSSQHNWTSLL